MKIYLVGGAVRDKLLGMPVKEKDWVVVGARTNDMINKGFRQVGKEFPVFLHPKTHEEYALARMERKVKPGYKGFTFDASPEVSLEEDLLRRDLTINAMAESETGELIDPCHGKRDLEQKILRHVSPAFAEDPVRILRIGRFLARYADKGFHIAPETMALMQKMVNAGEVNALVAERVWKELERALGEPRPEKFFETLAQCGALEILFPHLKLENSGTQALIEACKISDDKAVRFAALLHSLPIVNVTFLCNKYRVPNAFKQLALLTAKHYESALEAKHMSAENLVALFQVLDIYRRHPRFHQFLFCCQAIARIKQMDFDVNWLIHCAQVANSIDVQALLAKGLSGATLVAEIKEKRLEKIKDWLAPRQGQQ